MTITLERVPLQTGQQFLLGVNHEDRREWHPGRIVSRAGVRLLVDYPPEAAVALGAAEGAEVIIDTWRIMDARYTLRARVLEVLPDGEPRLDLELLDGTRVQHREYFRVPVSLNPDEAWLESESEQSAPIAIRLHLRDLSAGGVRARCDRMLNVTSTIRIEMALPGSNKRLDLRARVVRVVDEPGPTDWPCEVGAAFTELTSLEREEIIHFALRLQADQIKRGVI